jgi:hypothetical protein
VAEDAGQKRAVKEHSIRHEKEYYTAIHVPKNTIRKAQTRQPAVSAGCGSRRLYGPKALGATIWQMAWGSRLALVGKVLAS